MKKTASLFITSMIGAFIALFAYTTFIETPVEKVVTIEKTSSMVVVDDNLELNKESMLDRQISTDDIHFAIQNSLKQEN